VTDDLYAVLEVRPSATSAEIRAAFRRLARAHHPDLGAASAARMIALNRAYAVLSDPEKRRRYDAQRQTAAAPSAPPPVRRSAPAEVAPEEPPWRLDFERGDDLDDWRQMYAEERQVWEQLLRSRPGDPDIKRALDRAVRDQLELENAIRRRLRQAHLTQSDLNSVVRETRAGRAAEAKRVGCAAVLFALLGARLPR